MAKRKYANSVKNSRWWQKLSRDGMSPYLVGAKFKGMGKSNIRKLPRRLTKRALDDADWWDCDCGIANHPSWQACQFCQYPRRQ